jgi:hypothetical protein
MRQRPDQGQLFEPDPPLVRRTRRGTDQTIRELRRLGRVEPVELGLVAMLRTLADLIDAELGMAEPNKWTVARLASEWRQVHAELRGRQREDSWDEQLAAFFQDDDPPAVLDTPPP